MSAQTLIPELLNSPKTLPQDSIELGPTIQTAKDHPATSSPLDNTALESSVGRTGIDGGVRGWSTVAGSWLAQFCVVGAVSAFGVTETFYASRFLTHFSPSQINWIGSLQLCFMFLLGLAFGKPLDKGYFHAIALTGSVLFVFSMFMLSLARHERYYQVFLAQGVGMGAGLGILYMPSSGIVAHHFSARRSLAMGIVSTGGSLGGFFFSSIFNHFINGPIGFARGIRISAFVCLGSLTLANMLMRVHPAPKSATTSRSAANPAPIAHLLRDGPYLLTVAFGFVLPLGLYFPMFMVQLFAESTPHISPGLTGWLLAILNFSSTLGRVLPNGLADYVGVFQVYIPCMTLAGILSLVMLVCTTPGSIVAFCVLYGFASGAIIALYLPAVIALDPDLKVSGMHLGLACSPVGISSLIGTPIGAALVGKDRWWAGCLFTGLVELFAAALLVLAYTFESRKRKSWRW